MDVTRTTEGRICGGFINHHLTDILYRRGILKNMRRKMCGGELKSVLSYRAPKISWLGLGALFDLQDSLSPDYQGFPRKAKM
jgi:hypothetical protein